MTLCGSGCLSEQECQGFNNEALTTAPTSIRIGMLAKRRPASAQYKDVMITKAGTCGVRNVAIEDPDACQGGDIRHDNEALATVPTSMW
jgi:hypothetical protein